MSTEVKCLRPVERVGIVYDLLKNVSHGNFPIVDTASSGTLYGTASRSMLCTLLQRRAFGQPHDVNNGHYHSHQDGSPDYAELLGPKRLSPLVQWDTIERVYPRYPTIDDVELRPGDRNCWLDLRPYANTAPYTINETASIQVCILSLIYGWFIPMHFLLTLLLPFIFSVLIAFSVHSDFDFCVWSITTIRLWELLHV